MLRNPAEERNVCQLLKTLKKYINGNQERKNLLEISSGVGLHAQYLSKTFPNLNIQTHQNLIQECLKVLKNILSLVRMFMSQYILIFRRI
ncbi:hypothetical protein PVAND_014398 [Polypedilum vanderplanki]|uniref:Uncharacterized protein n=1 Tax=Polypedilum vanderplanki TaxID=319348 RepID=A0A9J6B9M7_POLVA|nr:hypothetical protein PVAND_014398 [Polypedilum vanderplanki]